MKNIHISKMLAQQGPAASETHGVWADCEGPSWVLSEQCRGHACQQNHSGGNAKDGLAGAGQGVGRPGEKAAGEGGSQKCRESNRCRRGQKGRVW